MLKKEYQVSAIVSVYNCKRFITECLKDLEQQTIADKLEIVVVNSGSQQNEESIIKRFQKKYDNIVYIKTENRETLYQAWNRGIKAASGIYITNANTDDRHKNNALEVMVNELENNKDIDLVYYDFIVTETVNETFDNCTPIGYQNWPEFDKLLLVVGPSCGHQPMWRKKLHEEFGYFDESLRVAGDYEFWLRITEKCKFKHIREYLGLYLKVSNSVERRNREVALLESYKTRNNYIGRVSQNKKLLVEVKRKQAGIIFDLGCIYFQNKQFILAMRTFFRSIIYSWNNFECYRQLLIFFLPPMLTKVLVQIKKYFRKITIQLCQRLV